MLRLFISYDLGLKPLALTPTPNLSQSLPPTFTPTKDERLQQRLSIREVLASDIKKAKATLGEPTESGRALSADDLANVKDLSNSRPLRWASISHTSKAGGYAWTDSEKPLGFDLEDPSQITAAVVERVALNSAEFISSPSPAFLWVAKEAAFKGLSHHPNLQVMSQVPIEFDSILRPSTEASSVALQTVASFQAFLPEHTNAPRKIAGVGQIGLWNDMIFSVFWANS
jgi:hypothetical protein